MSKISPAWGIARLDPQEPFAGPRAPGLVVCAHLARSASMPLRHFAFGKNASACRSLAKWAHTTKPVDEDRKNPSVEPPSIAQSL